MSANSYQTEMMLLVSGCQHISFQLFGYFTLMKSSHKNVGGIFILFILRDMLYTLHKYFKKKHQENALFNYSHHYFDFT